MIFFSCWCKIHSPVHFNLTIFFFRFEEMKAQKRNEDKTRSDALLLLLSFKSLNSHTQKGGIALTMDTFASKQEAKRGQIPSMHFKALTQSLFLYEKMSHYIKYVRIHSHFGCFRRLLPSLVNRSIVEKLWLFCQCNLYFMAQCLKVT